MTDLEKELLRCLRALFNSKHISLGDLVYQVREREGLGWDGPAVTAWSNAVTEGETLLKKHMGA